MDIKGAASIVSQSVVASGRAGSNESVVVSQQIPEDSIIERKEVERSDPGAGIGKKVDVDA